MAGYVRRMHDAGIPMLDVFRIVTINGARSIGVDEQVGTIQIGKRANLVLFDGDLLADPADLFGPNTVIKDGVVYDIDDPK
jgi:imidazolonepropionase-like amidohydrolase